MTGIKKRTPTNKEFKTNFQGLASTKPKKGHLTDQSKKAEDVASEIGELIRIEKDKLYENGWEVKVGKGSSATTYKCSYGSGIMYIPDSNITDKYYVPKKKTEVEVTIDKKSKVYTVVKINTSNKKPVALFENTLTISTNTNKINIKDFMAQIQITQDVIKMQAEKIALIDKDKNTVNLMESQKKIQDLENQNNLLLERIEILEKKIDN